MTTKTDFKIRQEVRERYGDAFLVWEEGQFKMSADRSLLNHLAQAQADDDKKKKKPGLDSYYNPPKRLPGGYQAAIVNHLGQIVRRR